MIDFGEMMPGRNVHVLSAFLLSIVFVILFSFVAGVGSTSENGLIAVAAVLGSIFPDLLEPARNYRHRKFFHSKLMLKMLLVISLVSLILSLLGIYLAYYIFVFMIGYILHLLLDSLTKMGLPK